jgi:hypothetical protein
MKAFVRGIRRGFKWLYWKLEKPFLLPETGCLRLISKTNPPYWIEYDLANYYILVLPDHPVRNC